MLIIVLLSVVMLSAITLNAVILSVVMLGAVLLLQIDATFERLLLVIGDVYLFL
jgi:hypothetical protein